MPKNYKVVVFLRYDFGIKLFLDCVAIFLRVCKFHDPF